MYASSQLKHMKESFKFMKLEHPSGKNNGPFRMKFKWIYCFWPELFTSHTTLAGTQSFALLRVASSRLLLGLEVGKPVILEFIISIMVGGGPGMPFANWAIASFLPFLSYGCCLATVEALFGGPFPPPPTMQNVGGGLSGLGELIASL